MTWFWSQWPQPINCTKASSAAPTAAEITRVTQERGPHLLSKFTSDPGLQHPGLRSQMANVDHNLGKTLPSWQGMVSVSLAFVTSNFSNIPDTQGIHSVFLVPVPQDGYDYHFLKMVWWNKESVKKH